MKDLASTRRCTAFKGSKQVATGTLEEVVLGLKGLAVAGHADGVLVFDDLTAEQIDLDLRDLTQHYPEAELEQSGQDPGAARPGRPKLGVVAKEVTLLPRHWQWLSSQPGGASVALRKLVDEARRCSSDRDAIRQSQEAAYKFMSATAGNYEGFEEATRALFSRDLQHFEASTRSWPPDIFKYARRLALSCLAQGPAIY